jgi:hypothetical protein
MIAFAFRPHAARDHFGDGSVAWLRWSKRKRDLRLAVAVG